LIREVSATPILIILAYWIEHRPNNKSSSDGSPTTRIMPQWSDMPSFLLLGLTGIFGNQLFFILGLSTSPSITAAVIQPLAPIWTILFALMLRMEVISMAKISGIALAVFGSLITLGFFNLSLNHLGSGAIFFLLNTACMGAYFLFQKPLLKRFPPITTTATAYLLGASMMSVTALVFQISGHLTPIDSESFSKAFLPLIYTIIGPSIGTYLLIAYANSKLDSTLVSASKTMQPLSASILAYFLLGESLLPQHAIGAIFLLCGMAVMVTESKPLTAALTTIKERTP
jgi:drug/metabolite transporter (DMT)-like permease